MKNILILLFLVFSTSIIAAGPTSFELGSSSKTKCTKLLDLLLDIDNLPIEERVRRAVIWPTLEEITATNSRVFDIGGHNLSNDEFNYLAKHISKKTKTIDVNKNNAIDPEHIIEALKSAPNIRKLNLFLTKANAKSVLDTILKHNKNIEDLTIDGITPELLPRLKKLKKLKRLDITNGNLDPRSLAEFIADPPESLVSISVPNRLIITENKKQNFYVHGIIRELSEVQGIKYNTEIIVEEVFFPAHKAREYVYDGDTPWVDIPYLGPELGHGFPIRIYGIDTAEMKTKDPYEKKCAIAAQNFILDQFLNAKSIELQGAMEGKYFRLVSDIYFDGKSLTSMLVDMRLGYIYLGETKLPETIPQFWEKFYKQNPELIDYWASIDIDSMIPKADDTISSYLEKIANIEEIAVNNSRALSDDPVGREEELQEFVNLAIQIRDGEIKPSRKIFLNEEVTPLSYGSDLDSEIRKMRKKTIELIKNSPASDKLVISIPGKDAVIVPAHRDNVIKDILELKSELQSNLIARNTENDILELERTMSPKNSDMLTKEIKTELDELILEANDMIANSDKVPTSFKYYDMMGREIFKIPSNYRKINNRLKKIQILLNE